MDEAWSYVGKKQRKVEKKDGKGVGDQYVFIALDATGKGIISYRVGKRDRLYTETFLNDLRQRVLGRPEISSDSFHLYQEAVSDAFGTDCRYGQIVKHFKGEPPKDAISWRASSAR